MVNKVGARRAVPNKKNKLYGNYKIFKCKCVQTSQILNWSNSTSLKSGLFNFSHKPSNSMVFLVLSQFLIISVKASGKLKVFSLLKQDDKIYTQIVKNCKL